MLSYPEEMSLELSNWQRKMMQNPSFLNNLAARVQTRVNKFIPEKVHRAITETIKQMIRAVIFGAQITTGRPNNSDPLEYREAIIRERIKWYKTTAAAEGGITGAGGILLGLADFPLLLSIKLKLLFEIAALYGYDTRDYKERVYLLYIFQLAFSSQKKRREVYEKVYNWEADKVSLPEDINQFDWRSFQQEYRDYIDLAKMAQLLPVIGAPVGLVANYQLIKKLGVTAMNAYRMREPGVKNLELPASWKRQLPAENR